MQCVRFALALVSYILYDTDMSNVPASIPELISQWPTIGEFAVSIDCGYEAARQMNNRGRIAPHHWAKVVLAAQERGIDGITLEWLATQRAHVPAKVSA